MIDATIAPPRDGLPGETDDRTRQIVEAAYGLLAEEGLEGLTIRAVLLRTGLARRAFYERFAGKDDLVLGVFTHAIRMATAHYAAAVAGVADPLDRLRIVITSIALGTTIAERTGADRNRHGIAMSREHLRLANSRPADLQTALSPLLDLLARLMAEGMAAGVVRRGSPERLATLVYNLVSTTVHAEFLAHATAVADRAHRAALADDIWQFCRRGIAAGDRGETPAAMPDA